MRKVLDIDLTPPIQTFNNMAIPLGVLSVRSQYLSRLYAYRYGIPIFFYLANVLFDGPPFRQWDCFDCVEVDSEKTAINKNFADLILESINQNQYAYVPVNERYIPQRRCFGKEDFNHDLLIHGYDDEKKEFMTCACNAQGQYRSQVLPFDVVERAFYMLDFDGADDIVLFSVKNPLELSESELIDKAENGLRQYMNCASTFKFPGHYYGMEVYEALQNSLSQDSSQILDMRNFRILFEQKRVISELLHHICCQEAEKDFRPVVDYMRIIFNLAIKYDLKPNVATKSRIFQYLDQCKKTESDVLNKWVD